MYSFLVRIFLFVCALWFVRRLLSVFFGGDGKKVKPDNFADRLAKPASDTVKDPVCGMYMDPRLAVRLEKGKGTLYFCSEECKRQFLDKP